MEPSSVLSDSNRSPATGLDWAWLAKLGSHACLCSSHRVCGVGAVTSQVWITSSNLAQVWNDFILLRYKDSWVRTGKSFERRMEGHQNGWKRILGSQLTVSFHNIVKTRDTFYSKKKSVGKTLDITLRYSRTWHRLSIASSLRISGLR